MSDSEITHAGTGESLPEEFTRNAILFVINAHAATVNMRLYPPTSSMVTETFEKARECVDVAFEYFDSVNVATIENALMINNTRLADIEQSKAPVRSFVAWMTERGLSVMEFQKGLTGEELQTCFSILSEMADVQDRAKLTEDLREQGVEHVLVNQRVYVAVTTSETGEIIGGVQGAAAPLDALKDELLMRYLMGKVDLGSVEDRELVEVLSDAGKVGGLLSRFLGEEGSEGGVLMKSQKAEEALGKLADMVGEIDDEALRDTMGDQITRVIAEMSPREMTSVLSGRAPENLNIRHVRENVITMLSDNQLLDMIDSLIDEYVEMKGESGELELAFTKQRLKDLNELLSDVRGERGEEISQAIDEKLDEAGIQEERDPHTGTRVLSAYQMLGGPLEEEDIDLGEGVDHTVPRQIRQLYAMEESDLAAGMLLKILENLNQESDAVRRYAARLIKETVDGLDEEHAIQALDVIRPMMVEDLRAEGDYESFVLQMEVASKMAELFMKAGRAEEASEMMELIMAESSSGKSEELVKYAAEAAGRLMGPEGMIDVEAILLEEDDARRLKTVQALAAMGPPALAPLVDMVKDRGQIELRDRALEAIQMAGEPGIAALLGELEKENPWYIYRNVLNVVADLRLAQGLPQVKAMAANPDERIRREAVRTMARIGSPDCIETVLSAASDQSIAVRRTAVRVLGMFGDKSVAGFLLDIINGQGLRGKDEDQGVVESACLALGDLKDKEFVPQLAELLSKGGLFKKSRPDEIRAAACIALGNVGDESAVGILEKAAKDPSAMVRSSAEKALRRLKGGLMVPEIVTGEEAVLATTPLADLGPIPEPEVPEILPPPAEDSAAGEPAAYAPEPVALEQEAPDLVPEAETVSEDSEMLQAEAAASEAEGEPAARMPFEPLPPPMVEQQVETVIAEEQPPPFEEAAEQVETVIAEEQLPPFEELAEQVESVIAEEQLPPFEAVPPVETVEAAESAAFAEGDQAGGESPAAVEEIDWDAPVEGEVQDTGPVAAAEAPQGLQEAEPVDPSTLEYILTEQGAPPAPETVSEAEHVLTPVEERAMERTEEPVDPSSLEYMLTEKEVEEQPTAPEQVSPQTEEGPAAPEYDASTLEGMILRGETAEAPWEVPAGAPLGQASEPAVPGAFGEEADRPARLTLEPPSDESARDETGASDSPMAPELAALWPEGSLNGHDYPVPPPPEAPAEAVEPEEVVMPFRQGDSIDAEGEGAGLELEAPADQDAVAPEGLPTDDYAPGRTDQPSTMERMLGTEGAVPQAPPADTAPEPPPEPPSQPPPPSGWK